MNYGKEFKNWNEMKEYFIEELGGLEFEEEAPSVVAVLIDWFLKAVNVDGINIDNRVVVLKAVEGIADTGKLRQGEPDVNLEAVIGDADDFVGISYVVYPSSLVRVGDAHSPKSGDHIGYLVFVDFFSNLYVNRIIRI